MVYGQRVRADWRAVEQTNVFQSSSFRERPDATGAAEGRMNLEPAGSCGPRKKNRLTFKHSLSMVSELYEYLRRLESATFRRAM